MLDIGLSDGRIVALEPGLVADAREIELGGRLVTSGFVESHLHLDKSCILERCQTERGDLDEAISEVAKAKADFTPEDVYARGQRTLEKCILNGTSHMRTQLEVDPVCADLKVSRPSLTITGGQSISKSVYFRRKDCSTIRARTN